jgi:hypothetical protein
MNLNYKNFGKHVPKILYRDKIGILGVKKSHGGEENLLRGATSFLKDSQSALSRHLAFFKKKIVGVIILFDLYETITNFPLHLLYSMLFFYSNSN